jgi:hypothetical protein
LVSKTRESQLRIVRGLQPASRIFEEFQHSAIQTKKNANTSADFIYQIKVCQPIGRKVSIQAICRRMRRLEAILHLAAQNFEILSKIKDEKSVNSTGLGLLSMI